MGSIDIVAVGDSCGKTALLHAMRQTDFKIGNELEFINIPPTVFESYQVNFKSHGVYIRVNLHDTAGQENYDRLRPLAYQHSIDVVFLVFAVISPDSIKNIEAKWIPEINYHLKNVPRILVGTRSESRDDERILAHLKKMKQMPVMQKDIDVICKRHSLEYFETSAETGYGIEACLNAAKVQKIVQATEEYAN
ncbi:rho-related GTP-binding protein RhoB-like [Mytilus trossulus]|uniref:rho-related GTP-binding protein RhoB-like n=1 Tax=Mytilus trossulus TaxID=6551 RepID=UPI003004491F